MLTFFFLFFLAQSSVHTDCAVCLWLSGKGEGTKKKNLWLICNEGTGGTCLTQREKRKSAFLPLKTLPLWIFLQVITLHIQVNFITQRLSFSGASVDGFKRLNDFLLLCSPYWQSFPFVPVAVLHDLDDNKFDDDNKFNCIANDSLCEEHSGSKSCVGNPKRWPSLIPPFWFLHPPFLRHISKCKITSVLFVLLCRQVTGWREYRPIPSPSEDSLFQDGASVSRHPIMEPTKVQSEGGLNVTLTIRLLMHGKVSRRRLSGSGWGEKTPQKELERMLNLCLK